MPKSTRKSCFSAMLCVFLIFLINAKTMPPIFAEPVELLPFQLDERPFAPDLCKTTGKDRPIQIHVKHHRAIRLQRIEGQYIPADSTQARTKQYVHFVALSDLTDGIVEVGAIAFDRQHAVLFTPDHPKGIARTAFLRSLPDPQRPMAEQALATFLALHPVFNAAIDTCRAYPPFVTYGTDEEIERIEAARHSFTRLARAYNDHPTAKPAATIPDPVFEGGYVVPQIPHTNISYHALNPLNFHTP